MLRCSRNENGDVGFQRGTKWLADELGYSTRSIEYARQRLVQLELLEVLRRGDGDSRSLYRVVVERIRVVDTIQDHLLPAAVPVHPPEKAVPTEASEPQRLRPGADTVSIPARNGCDPYTRARAVLEVPGRTTPLPPSDEGGQSIAARCTHGRTACRACGTTPRQQAKAARAAAALATANELKAQQDAAREQRAAVEAARLADAADGRSKGYQWAIDHLAEQGVAGFGVSRNQSEQEEAS